MDGAIDRENPSQWAFLREDLELINGAPDRHGAPSWTLHDPVAGKFYKIGWLEFEILSRWHVAHPQLMVQDITQKTLLRPTLQDIQTLYQFLIQHNLLGGGNIHQTKMLLQNYNAKRQISYFQQGLKNYLFFRIPLCYPDRFFDDLKPFGNVLLSKAMTKLMMGLLMIALFLIFRDFSEFLSGFQVFQTPQGLIGGFVALAFSKVIHEMGHAMISKHYGCRVPAMGVAFIVMWPLLWTDTTDAWRLRSHQKRLCIDAGGMVFELSLAIVASILWVILPTGGLKDAMHMLAGVTWLMTLLVNLNPFMRFDGYYLLSDGLNFPNLQDRSFALAKWFMRSKIWGIQTEKPEAFPQSKTFWLVAYAFGTWLYRLFLFLGIALLVYHFFFKALGVFLFIVEIWWFILRPIQNELSFWWKNRADMKLSIGRKIIFLSIFACLIAFVMVPWKGYIIAPAIVKSVQEVPLLSPQEAKIKTIHIEKNTPVQKGDLLFSLDNADIQKDQTLTSIQYETLQKDYKNRASSKNTYHQATILKDELVKTSADQNVLSARQNLLTITAPISGTMIDIPDDIFHSEWVEKKEILGLIRSSQTHIETFVKETDLAYLSKGEKALFYGHIGITTPLNAVIERIETSPMKDIPYPEMGADKGGDIAVSYHPETNKPIPATRLYRVVLRLSDPIDTPHTLLGAARIQTKPQSLISKTYKKVVSIIIQESGL